MLEQFAIELAASDDEDEAAEIDAAAASRARTELEAARTRAGLPR